MNSNEFPKEQFDKLKKKYKNAINTRSFSLGFMIGIGLALRSRVSFSQEKFWTRPWATLATGLFFGTFLHWWNWKKRMMLEEICQREDELEIKNLEYSLQFTKAGDDMEKPAIVNYLKKEKLI